MRVAEQRSLSGPSAEARMSLAWVLLDAGRTAAALAQADRAAAALHGVAAARLRGQRALVLQRAGRLAEALEDFRAALPVLARAGDDAWEARLRNNRGLLRAYRGDLDGAERDLERAGALFAGLGQHLHGAWVSWNLGFVAARRGDVPGALQRYDATQAGLVGDVPVPELLVDRAEVLLSAGLADEARTAADEAVTGLRALGRRADLAEALLLQAQSALAADCPLEARDRARQAERGFRRQGRPGWALVARYVALRAGAAAGDPPTTSAAMRTAAALDAAGWRVLALDLRLLAAEGALAAGRPAQALLRSAAAARHGTVDLRVRAWYAEALLRTTTEARPDAAGAPRRTPGGSATAGARAGAAGGPRRGPGRSTGVDAALRAGLRAAEQHRATLGATELRVRAATYGGDLVGLGLRRALAGGDPRRVLVWSERGRAGALRLQPVTPPSDSALAGLLADLRRVTAELEGALLEGRPGTALRARRTALEREVLAASRRLAGPEGQGCGPVTPAALREQAAGRCVLVLLTVDGELHAVVLSAGRWSSHALGPVLGPARALDALLFALRRLASGQGSPAALAAALGAARSAARRLDDLLLGPLRARLGDGPLVVVPTAALHAVPWALLPLLSGRPVVVSPSATAWRRADALPPAGTAGAGLLVAGPGLPGAAQEVATLAQLHAHAQVLTGAAADAPGVLAALGTADWAHLAAHGRLRTDNPLLSALELADGPLTVYDLERVPQVPRLLALPACLSGVGTVHAGEEVLGLTGALLARGARTVIATVLPVPDAASRDLMLALHARLAVGEAPPHALAAAQAATPLDAPQDVAAVAGFVCLGA